MAATGARSGGDLEQLGDEGGLGPHVASANLPNLPLPDHRHRLVACQCSSCRPETAEAEPWSDQAFHAPMVLFHYVIEELALPQPRASPQLAVLFHPLDGTGVGRVLVHRDRARVYRMRLPECLTEEALCGLSIPLGREQEIDRLAAAVDRPIQVGPAALNFHIGLVDPPRAVARPQMRADPLLDLWRVGLDPAKDRRMVHTHAAVL